MKDFDKWNRVKKMHDSKGRLQGQIFCKERDISWIALGVNIGDEEDGKGTYFERPVIVIKKFNNNLFWGCALSSQVKKDNKCYIAIETRKGVRSVIISQLRLYDTKRLRQKFDVVHKEDFQKVKTAIKQLL